MHTLTMNRRALNNKLTFALMIAAFAGFFASMMG